MLDLERRWRWRRWRDLFLYTCGVFADERATILHEFAAGTTTVEPVDIIVKATLAGLWLAEG